MSRVLVPLAVLAFWLALGLIEAAFFSTDLRMRGMTWSDAWRRHLPPWLMFAALTPVLGVVAGHLRVDPANWRRRIPAHLVIAVAFVLVHLTATNVLVSALLGQPLVRVLPELAPVIGTFFAVDLFFYAAIVAAFHVIHYYRESRDRAVAASRLEASLTDARLQALRAQLEPHFLYNTLNAISTLALRGESEAVVATVGHLGQLLRGTLDEGRAQEIRLGDELEILQPYLAIQRLRFGDRLAVALDVPADLRDARVPSLILQPLVENAVHHGIAAVDGGRIEVRAMRCDGRLALEVRDSGPGLARGRRPAAAGNGVGLANTRARLAQLYGAEQSLELADLPDGGAVARVTLPWRTLAANAAEAAGR